MRKYINDFINAHQILSINECSGVVGLVSVRRALLHQPAMITSAPHVNPVTPVINVKG